MAMLTLEQQQTLAFEHVRNALVHRLGRKATGAQWQQFEDRLKTHLPALLDKGDAVEITVYDDPAVAERHHRQGVVRLFALAMNEALKSLARDVKKNASLELGFNALPGSGGKSAPLAEQLAQAAIIRSFLQDGLPQDDAQFQKALADGRPRMLLTAQELARLLQSIVTEHGQIRRKLTGLRADRSALDDIEAQLAALFPPGFLHQVGYEHLQHYPRYLKAVVMRLPQPGLMATTAGGAKLTWVVTSWA